MTHRSKKPFECKFDGCDKSYCDARSLRRHYENHHQQNMDGFPVSDTQGASGSNGQYFQFSSEYRQRFLNSQSGTYVAGAADMAQKSPGYMQQVSPISPAHNQGVHPAVSPGLNPNHKPWTTAYNPLEWVLYLLKDCIPRNVIFNRSTTLYFCALFFIIWLQLNNDKN